MTRTPRHGRRAGLVAFVASVAILLVGMASPTPAPAYNPATSPGFFGVTGNALRAFAGPTQANILDRLATSMSQQGVSWSRLTLDQNVEERQRGIFNWYVPDTMVAALARHGVRGAAVFIGTAPWEADPALNGRCGWRAYPYDLEGWAQWVAEAAKRYGENGTFWALHPELPRLPIRTWEIGNEPNWHNFWCPGADAGQYARVYARSMDAITAIDPSAQVIVAGLAPMFGWAKAGDLDVPEFLKGMDAANPSLRSRIPAVAIHPYGADVGGVLNVVARFRQAMTGVGMANTPMLVNEVGWYTQGPASTLMATEQQRAERIGALANTLWRTDCGISGFAPHTWVTLEQDPGNSEHWFGLASASTGDPYPSAVAYGDQIRLATGQGTAPPPTGTLNVCQARAPATCPSAKRPRRSKDGRKAKRARKKAKKRACKKKAKKARKKAKRARKPATR